MQKAIFPLFLLLILTSALPAQTNPILEVQSFQLDNGFTVLLNEDTTATKVFGAVMVNAGAKNEYPSATGMAHYLEHLLFKGTTVMGTTDYEKEKPHLDSIRVLYDELALAETEEDKTRIQQEINAQAKAAGEYGLPNEFDKLLKSIGGTGINAFTGEDMTFYHNSFPAHEMEKWLDLYSTRFTDPVFRSFQSELEVVYEEKNRSMDDFGSQIFDDIQKMLFPNVPYGQWPVLGTIEHLKKPSLNKMYEFFERNYVPGNMALILTGNFDSDAVIPLIRNRFGAWQAKEVPSVDFSGMAPLEGETVVTKRMTPIKLEVLGYRTVPEGHPDRLAVEVCEYLLSNGSQTGYLDQLQQDSEIMFSGAFSLDFSDAGAMLLFFVPKVLVQSLRKAEKKVEGAFEKVQGGDFTDEMLMAAKNDLSKSSQRSMEGLTYRGITIGEAFNRGRKWEEVLAYPEEIQKVSREDVIRVANTYFGENRIKYISKTGFPKKTKLDKPPFEAAKTDQKGTSEYAERFESIPSQSFQPRFIDFEKAVGKAELPGGSYVYTSPNPVNKLFYLQIRFRTGTLNKPELESWVSLMNYGGAGEYDLKGIKQAFAKLGCSYSWITDDNALILNLEGREEALESCLELANFLLTDPHPDEQSKKLMLNEEKFNRKFEKRTPSELGRALGDYATYGSESRYLKRSSLKQLQKLSLESTVAAFKKIPAEYGVDIIFIGQKGPEELSELLQNKLSLATTSPKEDPFVYREGKVYEKNQVFFIDDKKAIQSQVYFYVQGETYKLEQHAQLSAFNSYFGGGFSGLVLQEIREYRSLAYSTYAYYAPPELPGKKGRLKGYIGCQADKTVEAIEVMLGLINDMPEKPDRIESLRKNLSLKVVTNYPDFRTIPYTLARLKRKGYTDDPNREAFSRYENISMGDISAFHQEQVKGRPVIITVYGDKRKIDMEALKAYGEVTELKLEDMMVF